MESKFTATADMVRRFHGLFVNRRAYTVQSARPHPDSGRHYYFRPTEKESGSPAEVSPDVIRRHLEGEVTIGLYAVNPDTQRSKWVAIDADYRKALEDLLRLRAELNADNVEAALEKSKRGAHLWVLFSEPVLARDARLYVLKLAAKLDLPVKGAGLAEGIEVFPRQDHIRPGEFGNAIRAPLGVHRGAGRRFWFYHADYNLEAQFEYLESIRRVTPAELAGFIAGEVPVAGGGGRVPRAPAFMHSSASPFRILDYVRAARRVGRNFVARCPSCAQSGHDTAGDNLSISVEEPLKYRCWAGCTKEMIRSALGHPIPERRSA